MFQKVDYIYQKNIRDMVFLVGSFGLAYVRIGHQAVYMLQALREHRHSRNYVRNIIPLKVSLLILLLENIRMII